MYSNKWIHSSKEILQCKDEYGGKAFRLAELSRDRYSVPAFIGIGKTTITQLCNAVSTDDEVYKHVVKEIIENLNSTHYAVRSSAFTEDGARDSNAGKFLTKLDIAAANLSQAIQSVLNDAKRKGSATEVNPFSIIVQQYTLPEKAGVIFNRNPLGTYEIVIEWKKGNGEGVVGGDQSSQCVFAFQSLPKKIPFKECKELVSMAKKIEKESGFPQDIEWAVIEGKVAILQTRPITTLTESQYKAFLVLDTTNLGFQYYFDRGTLAESVACAPLLAQEILKYLYTEEGAITKTYTALGVTLKNDTIFTKFGNQLYIDKEKELHQFFPTHSYFGKSHIQPHFKTIHGLWTSIKNMYYLSSMKSVSKKIASELFRKHADHIHKARSEKKSFIEWLDIFNDIYKDVFTVNIQAEKAYKHLEYVLGNSSFSLFDVLSDSSIEHEEIETNKEMLAGIENKLIGNSINIADESIFTFKTKKLKQHTQNKALSQWWINMSPQKKDMIKRAVVRAKEYEALREEGRWLTVMCMNGMREALWQTIDALYIKDRYLGYFATLDELRKGTVSESELKKRFEAYQINTGLTFPSVISSIPVKRIDKVYGVSPGEARGEISIPKKNFSNIKKGTILLVDTLTPTLTIYFGGISGIISRQGGLLSHIAIVAREYGIPVVIDQTSTSYNEGQIVTIHGTKGTILKE